MNQWSLKRVDILPEQQSSLWENLLEKRTGVQLTRPQKVLLTSQVVSRMHDLDMRHHDQYFEYVQNNKGGGAEWQILFDRLLVKETTFFRHRPSLDFVRQFLHNRLTKQKPLVAATPGASRDGAAIKNAEMDSIEILSVGCSTGEESYGLAAIASDGFTAAGMAPYFGVTGIDISLPALATARGAIYNKRSLERLTAQELARYFQPYAQGQYRVVDSIRQRVCFSQLNLLALKKKPVQPMDVIFCQNVLIYFRRWRRREILKQLVKHLKPGGALVIGLGEVVNWDCPTLERVVHEDVQAYVHTG